jgi:hypothetical protein
MDLMMTVKVRCYDSESLISQQDMGPGAQWIIEAKIDIELADDDKREDTDQPCVTCAMSISELKG